MESSPQTLARWLARVGPEFAFQGLMETNDEAPVIVLDDLFRVVAVNGAARAACPALFVGEEVPAGWPSTAPDGQVRTWPNGRRYRHNGLTVPGGQLHVLLPVDDDEILVPPDAVTFQGMVSRDPEMLRVFQVIRHVAESEATVLVRGESGTGKELVARALHDLSPRAGGPFVAVNCAAFPRDLLESELFGHVRGAFTGAVGDREGIFARAHKGTLFLDEVGELPLDLQPKLLRVLETREVTPIGGRNTLRVDLRVVAATHRALREEVKAGRFREDLMYRLRVVPVFLPALRERRIDIEVLLRAGIERHNQRGLRRIQRVAPSAMRALLDHRWPGNVRELNNVLEYAYAVGRGPELVVDDLPPELRDPPAGRPATPPELDAERQRIEDAIREADGDLAAAARALGMSRTTFWRRRKALGLED